MFAPSSVPNVRIRMQISTSLIIMHIEKQNNASAWAVRTCSVDRSCVAFYVVVVVVIVVIV